jgi:type II secretory pathway component PulJ
MPRHPPRPSIREFRKLRYSLRKSKEGKRRIQETEYRRKEGMMEEWNTGRMECWSDGALEKEEKKE